MFLKSIAHNKVKQSGSALVTAIFVLVIMTLLGSALIRMQQSSSETLVYEVIGTRAYAAAQAGIQWQMTEIFPLNTTGATACANNIIEPDISNTQGLEGCFFNVTCDDSISHDSIQYYTTCDTCTKFITSDQFMGIFQYMQKHIHQSIDI